MSHSVRQGQPVQSAGGSDRLIVEDLSVKHDPVRRRAAFHGPVSHGLVTGRREVEDRQTGMDQDGGRLHTPGGGNQLHTAIIGTAVLHGRKHPRRGGHRTIRRDSQQSGDSAHRFQPTSTDELFSVLGSQLSVVSCRFSVRFNGQPTTDNRQLTGLLTD